MRSFWCSPAVQCLLPSSRVGNFLLTASRSSRQKEPSVWCPAYYCLKVHRPTFLLEGRYADFIFLYRDGLPCQQSFVTLHLCGGGFVSRFVCRVLQSQITRVDSGNQLSFFDPLAFYDWQVNDLSAHAEGQFHIVHSLYNAREVFSDFRPGLYPGRLYGAYCCHTVFFLLSASRQ